MVRQVGVPVSLMHAVLDNLVQVGVPFSLMNAVLGNLVQVGGYQSDLRMQDWVIWYNKAGYQSYCLAMQDWVIWYNRAGYQSQLCRTRCKLVLQDSREPP